MPTGAFVHASAAALTPAFLTVPVLPSTVRASRAFRVFGTLLPKHRVGAKTVQLRVWRLRNHAWVVVRTVWASNSGRTTSTRYTATLRLARGKYRIRAIAPADADNTSSGWTGYDSVTVR